MDLGSPESNALPLSSLDDGVEPRVTELRLYDTDRHVGELCNRNKALKTAIEAAEHCMRDLRAAINEEERIRLDKKCRELLREAERLKLSTRRDSHGDEVKRTLSGRDSSSKINSKLKEPLSSRQLSTREQIIILEGSKLNGFIFPPWKCPPDPDEFELKDGGSPFLDISELRLSGAQREVFDGWQRPQEIFSQPSARVADKDLKAGPTMISQGKVDLVQDITTDCSVVASLCAGTARAERGHAKIISSIIHPYDQVRMRPEISQNGKYVFRLHFNGCFRKVVIDDRLPASRTSRTLHVVDRNNPWLLWPALIEKAYLKIRGGYDFPGSNSGTDLWVLTGWIPEQVFLQSDDLIPNKLWRRVYNAFGYGDVLLTMGTGRLTEKEEQGLGLAGEHDFAVLDMVEIGEHRLVLVKNPWSKGTTWKGFLPWNSMDESSDLPDNHGTLSEHLKKTLRNTDSLEPGTFWMDLNSIFQSFESIYLNWNPGLFSYRQDTHFSWDLVKHHSAAGCFFSNPQYSVSTKVGGTVWLLLSKHFRTIQLSGDSDLESSVQRDVGFISLYAFESEGRRVIQSEGALHRGPYVDSPNTLLRFDMAPEKEYTIVVSEQSLLRLKYNFTLSAFSLQPVSIAQAVEKYTFCAMHEGAWTASNAGGNANFPSYASNPQFTFHLSAPSDVALLLESSDEDISIHVKLVWANGTRVTSVTTQDIAGDSGEYRHCCALAEIGNVHAGTYTIVCSTFDPGQLGVFVLRVGTMVNCSIKPIPVEGAGKLRPWVPPASFSLGVNKISAPLAVHRITRLTIIARHRSDNASQMIHASSPLKISLVIGRGPDRHILAVSANDDFSDSPAGVRVSDVDLLPVMHGKERPCLVVERLGGTSVERDEKIDVELLSEGPVEVGPWSSEVG